MNNHIFQIDKNIKNQQIALGSANVGITPTGKKTALSQMALILPTKFEKRLIPSE